MHNQMKKDRDIAIIGMACRFPGASDYRAFWDNLIDEKTFETPIPKNRMDTEGIELFKKNGANGIDIVNWGNFIDDIDTFDAKFFGISDQEAKTMEPEQRIMLELTWNCLEDACIRPSDLSGKNVGVFVGDFANDYKELISQNIEELKPHHLSGTAQCIIANRISYFYNFTGPSITIDTACSGSLTALHVACQSILQDESKIAMVAGSSMLLSPALAVELTLMKMLSPTGSCKTFDDLADGYARGEGACVILLKNLEDALQDGDPIHGIIKGSAVNHGGRVRSLTRPNEEAQAELIVQAVKNAGVSPKSITYLEAHGTGTPKGDPIEIDGLKKAFSQLYKEDQENIDYEGHIGLGSAKSSIGHLEAASGLAGIIKVLLSMEHKTLPRLTRFQKLNHRISLEDSPFYIVDSTRPWNQITMNEQKLPRRAGVSSFGFGGSNGHVILEEKVPSTSEEIKWVVGDLCLVVISAKTKSALLRYKGDLNRFLEKENIQDYQLPDIQNSLLLGRDDFEEKICIICDSIHDLRLALDFNNDSRLLISVEGNVSNARDKSVDLLNEKTILEHLQNQTEKKGDNYLQFLKDCAIYCLQNGENGVLQQVFADQGNKIALPGYSFDKVTYKIPYINVIKEQLQSSMKQLLHINCSSLTKQYYRSAFTCDDEVLSMIQRDDKQVLSSALLCEMAREAVEKAFEIRTSISLTNVDLYLTYVVENATLQLKTEIKKKNDSEYLVEIIDEVSERKLSCFEFCDSISNKEELLSPEQCVHEQEIYNYQDNLQVTLVKQTENKQWLHYSFAEMNDVKNHLLLMDYVLQILTLKNTTNISKSHIHIDQLQIDFTTKPEGYICIENNANSNYGEIMVSDMEGKVFFKTTGIKVIQDNDVEQDGFVDKLYKFIWKPAQISVSACENEKNIIVITSDNSKMDFMHQIPDATVITLEDLNSRLDNVVSLVAQNESEHIIWQFGLEKETVVDTIISKQDAGLYLMYEFIKKLLEQECDKKKLNFTIVTQNTQCISKNEKVNASHVGIWGFMGVLAKEFRKWHICLIDGVEGQDIPIDILTGKKDSKSGTGFGYRNQKFYSMQLQEMEHASDCDINTKYKTNGVYIIVGGAGGIGQVLTKYLIKNYKANVIWLGRRQKDDVINLKIRNCTYENVSPEYISTNVTSVEDLENAYHTIIQKYGNINGVVHSAIGALDRSIKDMSIDEYKNIVSVKLDGAVNLAQVFGKAELDFLVFFSSVASVQQLAGQSGYVTGSVFLDGFAHQLSVVENMNAKSVNWGYWGNIGIGQSMPDSSVRKIEMAGMRALNPESAMSALEDILNGSEVEYMFTPVMEDVFKEAFCVAEDWNSNNRLEELKSIVTDVFCKIMALPLSIVNSSADFEQYGINDVTLARFLDELHTTFECVTGQMFFMFQNIDEITEYIMTNETKNEMEKNIVKNQNAEFIKSPTVTSNLKEKLLERVTSYLKTILAEEMGFASSRIKNDAQLEQYGLDSIMIIHLTDLLKENIENFESTVFFECTSVNELAHYMTEHFPDELQKLLGIDEETFSNEETEVSNYDDISSVTIIESNNLESFAHEKEENVVEELAIVGMSGRFPMADNLNEFWNNIKNGRDCITEIPEERWSLDDFYIPDMKQALEMNLSYSKWGGFIDDFAAFDPQFFGITPKEAMNMDPQERLFLEESYKVLEDAGYTRTRISNKYDGNVGVFVGVTRTGYEWYGSELKEQNLNVRPNTSFSSMANRVSYYFNLNGPSIAVDTMCSSSLSALHVACESVRHGDCRMAIAGGVNIYTHPSTYEYLCQMHMLSKTGRCHTFGSEADGFVPGEGVGAILIKPLRDAIEDRDHIYAVIRGSEMNHGGKTNGFTVPNLNAQRELVIRALKKANVTADMVSYIEAHGTGTILGDPIEISALSQAFRKTTDQKQYCAISSVKTNIGHLEGAAGIAGVIKTVLQMNHQMFVPHIQAEVINPRINFKDSPFYVPMKLQEWKKNVIVHEGKMVECPRIAGVSAFGAGGTNAHVILEEYEPNRYM